MRRDRGPATKLPRQIGTREEVERARFGQALFDLFLFKFVQKKLEHIGWLDKYWIKSVTNFVYLTSHLAAVTYVKFNIQFVLK
jgi:hypothetical protein